MSALDRAQLGVAVEHVLDRRLIHGRRLLRHVAEDPFRRHVDIAGVRVQLAAQQREQARLTGAVCAGDADLLARKDGEIRGSEQDPPTAAQCDVAKLQHALSVAKAVAPDAAERAS